MWNNVRRVVPTPVDVTPGQRGEWDCVSRRRTPHSIREDERSQALDVSNDSSLLLRAPLISYSRGTIDCNSWQGEGEEEDEKEER